jgi:hypothetical protein
LSASRASRRERTPSFSKTCARCVSAERQVQLAVENAYARVARQKLRRSGREWMVFELPKGRWDIYMEYYTHGAYSSWSTDRNTVSLDINEWAALWLPSTDWTSTRRYQGDGDVTISGL